ncbi:hypothetical protein [Collimonas sp. OK607]|uniref:hypothetical protein n=1 Tax=Collimonas sp. OK607 TaxID=1798194 RepID=UPI00111426DA|nr:hypothetical protein [Collimonas sp. OK607]
MPEAIAIRLLISQAILNHCHQHLSNRNKRVRQEVWWFRGNFGIKKTSYEPSLHLKVFADVAVNACVAQKLVGNAFLFLLKDVHPATTFPSGAMNWQIA